MAWETDFDKIEEAICVCKKGVVTRHYISESNNWNNVRTDYYGEKIQCDDCKKKYHIECHEKRYFCPPWKGDGISKTYYLIPNGMTLKHKVSENYFHFKLNEEIVSKYEREILKKVIEDMKENKCSTRVKLAESKEVIEIYYKKNKKKKLSDIILLLEECENNYLNYEWTFDKMQKHRVEEEEDIKKKQKIIEDVISSSHELKFN